MAFKRTILPFITFEAILLILSTQLKDDTVHTSSIYTCNSATTATKLDDTPTLKSAMYKACGSSQWNPKRDFLSLLLPTLDVILWRG